MKTKICSTFLALMSICAFSQSGWVGINTPNPQANLDINGTMKIRQTPSAAALPGYQILAVNQNSGGDSQVSQVSPLLISNYVSNQISTNGTTNASIYAAKKTTGITLVALDLFPTGFRSVNFLQAERTVGSATLFSDTDNSYTIPSAGTYAVGFSFKYGTGLQASLLTNNPGIGIVRTRAGVATTIDSKPFSGANLIALSLTISESTLSSIYTFQAGDKISFGLTGSTALDAGLIGSSTSSFYIYKISN